jgi:hypothetical protein
LARAPEDWAKVALRRSSSGLFSALEAMR